MSTLIVYTLNARTCSSIRNLSDSDKRSEAAVRRDPDHWRQQLKIAGYAYTGSIWPAVVMHAVHNTAVQMFFDRITAHTARTAYFTGEFGIALVIPQAVLAIYCIRRLRTCEHGESELSMDTAALALSERAHT